MMNVFGVLAASFAVQALLRLRAEESGGQAEAVLATAVGRPRWLASHLVFAVAARRCCWCWPGRGGPVYGLPWARGGGWAR